MGCAECIYYDLSKEMVCQNNELSKEMKREMISQYGEKCPFCKVEKSTDIKVSSEGNFIGNIIEKTAYIIFCVGLISGLIQGYSINEYEFTWSVALTWLVLSIISCIIFLGFAEVIRLLDNINNKLNEYASGLPVK